LSSSFEQVAGIVVEVDAGTVVGTSVVVVFGVLWSSLPDDGPLGGVSGWPFQRWALPETIGEVEAPATTGAAMETTPTDVPTARAALAACRRRLRFGVV
jgi:hypothetical protein